MIENTHPFLASFEPVQPCDIELPCMTCDLNAEQPGLHGKRILIAEDEEPLRHCLRIMLEHQGHQVTEASNGAEALNLFTLGEFDLVITDFEMPVMQGDKLASSIKRLQPSLPVLMITGSWRIRRDAGNPVDVLLNKPFTATDLQWALAELFSGRPEAAEAIVSL